MPLDALHLTSQYPPVGQGGLGTHVCGLTGALASHLPVRVVGPGQLSGDPLDPETAVRWGLHAASAPCGVIHAHNYEVALPALIAQALTGVPLVVTLHLPAPEPYRSLERRLLEAADCVITVSGSLAREYLERGWRIPDPVVVPNGVAATFYRPEPGTQREASRLLFAGRLSPQKGCDLALYALRELASEFPALRLRVAGAGVWEQAYRNLARRLGIADRVRWLGWLEPAALREEYRRCTAFLMPSRFEPFGLSALEAMACGTPVIAANAGGLPDLIADDVTGCLVPPADPAALAHTMRTLLVNPARATQLGEAAVARARELTWDRAAGETLRVYRRLPPVSTRPALSPSDRLRLANEVVTSALPAELVQP